jgi:uncharacterized protein YjbI with pentapeptide repeats
VKRSEALELLYAGVRGIAVWNHRRSLGERAPNLSGAFLSDACLRNANLSGLNLEGASFIEASLAHADLRYANLSGACFRQADLSYANLAWSTMDGADLTYANAYQADLTNVDLSSSVLDHTSFHEAIFLGARDSLALSVKSMYLVCRDSDDHDF